jgi:acyl-[acyl-carrier-protein]-phospholipid O-acyltransferase/long-chain-fatty-acid--[acyl-carrier-protein] ligase
MITNLLLKGEVTAKYVPVAAIMMTVFLIDLYFCRGPGQRQARRDHAKRRGHILFRLDKLARCLRLFFTAFFGGIYAVPLNAIMQTRASPPKRSRVIAANNVVNAIFMITATVSVGHPAAIHLGAGTVPLPRPCQCVAAIWICFLLPQETLANFARQLFRLLYRVDVKGLEALQGGRAAGP